jgi:hypothetical protein
MKMRYNQLIENNHPTTKLKHDLLKNKEKLKQNNKDKLYTIIDSMMKSIAAEYHITPKDLHNMWIKQYNEIPDTWITKQ